MLSTPVRDAASSSMTSSERPSMISVQEHASIAGRRDRSFLAVEALRQNPRHGRLAGAAQPGEHVRVGEPAAGEGVFERPCDVRLPDELVERLRPPCSRQDLVHADLYRSRDEERRRD